MTDRISPAAVVAAVDVLDGEERVVLGEIVVGLAFTNSTVKTLSPREMEAVAAWLFALLERSPQKASPAYAPHRIVLGSLATELRGFAAAAGEPVGMAVDLRDAGSQAEERRVRERLADAAAAYDRHVDDVIASQHAQHDAATRHSAIDEEPATESYPAAPPIEASDDDLAWA